mmetsp:Transcript_119367/g.380673  ORF Transcript_119367/g.380673 Transcript_119367/m.380673 type:complete len:116 (-) Transcript_119367:2062-2409(-)
MKWDQYPKHPEHSINCGGTPPAPPQDKQALASDHCCFKLQAMYTHSGSMETPWQVPWCADVRSLKHPSGCIMSTPPPPVHTELKAWKSRSRALSSQSVCLHTFATSRQPATEILL